MSFIEVPVPYKKRCLGTIPISRKRRSIDCDKEGHHPLSAKCKKVIASILSSSNFIKVEILLGNHDHELIGVSLW